MINRFTHLVQLLNTNKPCAVVRMGNVEATALLKKQGIYSQMYSNAGFFGNEAEFKQWKSKYVKAILNADLNLKVITCPSFYVCDDVLTQLNIFLPTLTYMEDLNFWIGLINGLNTSKIGVVSYFKDDMEKQLKKLDQVHNKSRLSSNFNEWRIIKSENTIEGNTPTDKSFDEVFEDLVERCLNEDRDVYLISCGCYGLPLCNELKKKGKKALYVGGLLQLLFGIMGKRWLDRPVITQHINKHWIYPTEKPLNGEAVEGWCYGSTDTKTPLQDLNKVIAKQNSG